MKTDTVWHRHRRRQHWHSLLLCRRRRHRRCRRRSCVCTGQLRCVVVVGIAVGIVDVVGVVRSSIRRRRRCGGIRSCISIRSRRSRRRCGGGIAERRDGRFGRADARAVDDVESLGRGVGG